MAPHFDALEIRDPAERETDLFARLPHFLSEAVRKAEGLAEWLAGIDLSAVTDRKSLAALPVLRKPELLERQLARPPFGGFVNPDALEGARVFMSPGPIWEVQGGGADPWQAARAFFAAGVRPGARVHNAFAYHMTPGGFVLDTGARALGCTVFPAGTGNTDMQVDAAAAFRPDVYAGTPDFLKVMLDRADRDGKDLSSFRIGLVSGGALFPSLREEYRMRGIRVLQCYATAEFGVIAYEAAEADGTPLPGMVVNENLIVEIVRPGTDDPVPEGEVGELVVTSLNPAYPLVRLGTGDLSAVLPGRSPCGRTNMRIAGWMGRADQRTKVKGMFIDPKQIAELLRQHAEIERARLVVTREGASDAMVLHVETFEGAMPDTGAIEASLREITKVGGHVRLAEGGSLPRDGKVIADERDYSD
ncbi:phenylacetate--CoA ligase family protein [Nitratireductor sp. ZSWI3]|uniref:phenylacetate--CoA ligase family protein n=1 Tax=Nitratireductor sp. ZSWI3 TaxID=2966359 RepID=UPI00214FFAEF|nr:AMP-binding protein [Nitratireductor sp. ZSWI3]MCR4264996.1 AMP-binding protein [Nitratireductor sp. ZSWI3]